MLSVILCNHKKREIIEVSGGLFLYIPLTEEEKLKFQIQCTNPCWRIHFLKDQPIPMHPNCDSLDLKEPTNIPIKAFFESRYL